MKTSNRLQREKELQAANDDYIGEKRDRLRELDHDEEEVPKKKKRFNLTCCVFYLIIFLIAAYAILYFVQSVKDEVIEDYYDKKNQIEEMIPEGRGELEKSIEQGEDLFNNTKENVENIQDGVEKAQDLYETGQDYYEDGQELLDTVEDLKDKL